VKLLNHSLLPFSVLHDHPLIGLFFVLWKPLLRLLLVMLLATPLVVPPGGGGAAAAAPTPAPDYHHQLSPPWQLCVPAFPPPYLSYNSPTGATWIFYALPAQGQMGSHASLLRCSVIDFVCVLMVPCVCRWRVAV